MKINQMSLRCNDIIKAHKYTVENYAKVIEISIISLLILIIIVYGICHGVLQSGTAWYNYWKSISV